MRQDVSEAGNAACSAIRQRPVNERVRAGIDLETLLLLADREIGFQGFLRAARILDTGYIAVIGKLAGGVRLDVVLRARGNVVEINRRLHRIGNAREVTDETILRAGDEERRNHGNAGDRKSTRLKSSHSCAPRMPSSALKKK